MPVEHREVVLARSRGCAPGPAGRSAHVVVLVLVEVVPDPRPVGQQVLDGHVVGHQRAGRRRGANGRWCRASSGAELDQPHHHQRGQALGARSRSPNRVSTVFGMPCARSASPYAADQLGLAGPVDPHHAGEPRPRATSSTASDSVSITRTYRRRPARLLRGPPVARDPTRYGGRDASEPGHPADAGGIDRRGRRTGARAAAEVRGGTPS